MAEYAVLRNYRLLSTLSKSPPPPYILYMEQLSNSLVFNLFQITQTPRTNERGH